MSKFFKNIIFVLLLGCSGEEALFESDNFLNNNLENKNIIVAGSTLNDGAVIWINQNKIILSGDSDEATGLFFHNDKIYVTGWKYGGSGSIWSLNLDGTDQTLIELEGQFSEEPSELTAFTQQLYESGTNNWPSIGDLNTYNLNNSYYYS